MNKKIGVFAIASVIVAVLVAGCIGDLPSFEEGPRLYTVSQLNNEMLSGNLTGGDEVWVRGNITSNELVGDDRPDIHVIELDDTFHASWEIPTTIPTDTNSTGYRLNSLRNAEVGEEVALLVRLNMDDGRANGVTNVTLTLTVIINAEHQVLNWFTIPEWEAEYGVA